MSGGEMTAWLRVGRGRVWHLDTRDETGATVPWCGQDGRIAELAQPLPPLGGRPCPVCVRLASDLGNNVRAALAGGRAFTDPVVDAEILDDPGPDRPVCWTCRHGYGFHYGPHHSCAVDVCDCEVYAWPDGVEACGDCGDAPDGGHTLDCPRVERAVRALEGR